MIATMSVASVGVYSPMADRAVGEAGLALGKSLVQALAGSGSDDRTADIHQRVSKALQAAQTENAFSSPHAIARTFEILNALPRSMPLPDVVVEAEDAIGLDWDEGRHRVVSLTVGDTPMVGFAALFGTEPMYGKMAFFGEIPTTLRYLFRRLRS